MHAAHVVLRMNPRIRRIAAIATVVAALVVLGAVGLFYLAPGSGPPRSLPIPAGTVFSDQEARVWTAQFDVRGLGGRVVGTWTAYDGAGWRDLVVVNGSASPTSDTFRCPLMHPWDRYNGSIDVAVGPGLHTLYWAPCGRAASTLVNVDIALVLFALSA